MSLARDRVSRREGVKSGRPTVRDSKVTVLQVVELADEGLSPERIAEEFYEIPSTAAVRDAIEWAEENPDRVSELRQRRADADERLREVAIDI